MNSMQVLPCTTKVVLLFDIPKKINKKKCSKFRQNSIFLCPISPHYLCIN